MRSGRLGAVDSMRGGGCLTGSPRDWKVGETKVGMRTAIKTISGNEWSADFAGASWLWSGTVFLQHSSDFAVGAHLPFKQHSIACRLGELPAKQSKGRRSRRTAIRLIAM